MRLFMSLLYTIVGATHQNLELIPLRKNSKSSFVIFSKRRVALRMYKIPKTRATRLCSILFIDN
jgi:hypothetical protein